MDEFQFLLVYDKNENQIFETETFNFKNIMLWNN